MHRKLLITGGAGYIGSILTSFLIDNGYEVTIFDDLSTGSAIDSRATVVKASILDKSALQEALIGINAVIHCAAKSLVEESVYSPEIYLQVNAEGTRVLLEAMSNTNVEKIIFSSTAAVYGDSKVQPISEDSSIDPINPYGNSKFAAEKVISEFCKKGIAGITFRYFNVSGSYENNQGDLLVERHKNETHLIPIIMQRILQNNIDRKIEINGGNWPTRDGSCIRDYIHVLDLAKAHLLALDNFEKGSNRVFNLGSGVGYSVIEVVTEIEELSGVKLNRVIAPARAGDPAVLLAAIHKAKDLLGWSPEASLSEIIASSWQGAKQLG
jgi:UDP-glucose 4-epimerase